MRTLASLTMAGAMALAAAGFATEANASSLLFHFDPGASGIHVTDNTGPCLGDCTLSANLLLPFSDLTVEEGAANAQSFDFATFSVGGGWGAFDSAHVEAVLAFTSPSVGSASTGGSANYFTLGGFLTGGSLTWDNPIQNFTTADGSTFSVNFGGLSGITGGSNAVAPVTITVNSVAAVPEPATWGMMILGFGGIGALIRRRRSMVAFA